MKPIIIIIGIIAALLLVGTMSASDEQAAHDHYCAMVESGAWPDYREADCD